MKAHDILERFRHALGVTGPDPELEGLVAGDGETEVTGIATCFSPSFDVLAKAKAAGCNLLLADAHPYYSYDVLWSGLGASRAVLAGSPGVAAKRARIDSDRAVVVRLPTAVARAMPASAARAFARALGYAPLPDTGTRDFCIADIAPISAARFVRTLRTDGVRVIGDGALRVSRIAVANGLLTPAQLGRMLADPRVDMVVGGEVIEWEGGPYMQDVIAIGRRAALVLTGFAVSQEPAVDPLAAWVRTVMPGTKVVAIAGQDPIWTPKGDAK